MRVATNIRVPPLLFCYVTTINIATPILEQQSRTSAFGYDCLQDNHGHLLIVIINCSERHHRSNFVNKTRLIDTHSESRHTLVQITEVIVQPGVRPVRIQGHILPWLPVKCIVPWGLTDSAVSSSKAHIWSSLNNKKWHCNAGKWNTDQKQSRLHHIYL